MVSIIFFLNYFNVFITARVLHVYNNKYQRQNQQSHHISKT